MGRLVHTSLGSSYLIAHVLHCPPPPAHSFIIGPAVINTHTPVVGLAPATLEFFVVECASDSPYTYSSSTLAHRFPDERTPIEATPLSATCGAWVGFGSGVKIGFTLLLTRSFTRTPSSRHPPFTQYPFPPRLLVCGGQTNPHKPRLVVPHSTCPSLSPSPPAHSFS